MRLTDELWAELTSSTAHNLTITDATAAEISDGNNPSYVGIVVELHHDELDRLFTLLLRAQPETLWAFHDQLTQAILHAHAHNQKGPSPL